MLNLCGNALGDAGLDALAHGSLHALRDLAVGWNDLGDVAALAAGGWRSLSRLNVRANRLDPRAVACVLDGSLPALRELGLDENPLGDAGIAELVAAPGFAQLEWLNLGGTELDDRAARRIAARRHCASCAFTTTTWRRRRSDLAPRATGMRDLRVTTWDLTLELADRLDREPPRLQVFQTSACGGAAPSISVGGSALADVVVAGDDPSVHYHLIVDDAGAVTLLDAGAPTSVVVNGAAVDGVVGFGGDERLAVGDTIIRLGTVAPSELTWKLALRVTPRGGVSRPPGRGADGDIHVFHQAQVILGRSAKTADLAINDGNVSRKHCLFRVDDLGRVWLKDLGSTNGIHVNGHRIDLAVLSVSQKLYLGNYSVELAEPPKRVPQ